MSMKKSFQIMVNIFRSNVALVRSLVDSLNHCVNKLYYHHYSSCSHFHKTCIAILAKKMKLLVSSLSTEAFAVNSWLLTALYLMITNVSQIAPSLVSMIHWIYFYSPTADKPPHVWNSVVTSDIISVYDSIVMWFNLWLCQFSEEENPIFRLLKQWYSLFLHPHRSSKCGFGFCAICENSWEINRLPTQLLFYSDDPISCQWYSWSWLEGVG